MKTATESQIQQAKAQYLAANEETREALIAIFGKETFSDGNTVEEMTIEQILEAARVSDAVKNLVGYQGDDEELIGTRGFLAISAIRKVFNRNQTIDYTNGKSKYYVWVDMRTASGAGFSFSTYDSWSAHSYCGSRLCFLESKMATLAMKNFPHFFADMFNISQQIPTVQLRVLKTS